MLRRVPAPAHEEVARSVDVEPNAVDHQRGGLLLDGLEPEAAAPQPGEEREGREAQAARLDQVEAEGRHARRRHRAEQARGQRPRDGASERLEGVFVEVDDEHPLVPGQRAALAEHQRLRALLEGPEGRR